MKKSMLALLVIGGLLSSGASAVGPGDGTQRLVVVLGATALVTTALQRFLPAGEMTKHALSVGTLLTGMGAAIQNPTLAVAGVKSFIATAANAIANSGAVEAVLPNVPLVGQALVEAGKSGIGLVTCALYGTVAHAGGTLIDDFARSVVGL